MRTGAEGNWYILRSSDGAVVTDFLNGDTPIPYIYLPEYNVPDPPQP
ncbi:MAG: hypothetical protein ICV68_06190 [Pyrinomonadaceae bacterium]|nr:hypothetical protein [Pyrinomonadaceae bacterium]